MKTSNEIICLALILFVIETFERIFFGFTENILVYYFGLLSTYFIVKAIEGTKEELK